MMGGFSEKEVSYKMEKRYLGSFDKIKELKRVLNLGNLQKPYIDIIYKTPSLAIIAF